MIKLDRSAEPKLKKETKYKLPIYRKSIYIHSSAIRAWDSPPEFFAWALSKHKSVYFSDNYSVFSWRIHISDVLNKWSKFLSQV